MKHTPAPWKADEENCADGLNIQDTEGRRIAFTATIRNPDYTPLITDEAIANARLIAAAPELLEALRAFVANDDAGIVSLNAYTALIENARAAIQKAEG